MEDNYHYKVKKVLSNKLANTLPLRDEDDVMRRFDPSVDEITRLGRRMTEMIAEYFAGLREEPVYSGRLPKEILSTQDKLPVERCDSLSVMNECENVMLRYCTHTAHPRHLAYVNSTATVIGAFADAIASVANQNLSIRLNSPSATIIELLSLQWVKQILNYPSGSAGAFTSGGTIANLTCLAAAVRAKADFDIASEGLQSPKRKNRMIIYASEEVHACVDRSVDILGLGKASLVKIPTGDDFRMRVSVLKKRVRDDLRAGLGPFCVVANAGTVSTGAIDPLAQIAKVCEQHNLWFHIDAAYGGFAALCEEGRRLLTGLEMSDSVAVDPHKWLFIPYECGCYLVKDPKDLKKAFAIQPSYIKKPRETEDLFNFIDYGVQMSRGFRGLKVWMTLKQYGTRALGLVVERNIHLAKHLEHLVAVSEDLQALSRPVLSILCFRFTPKELKAFSSSNRIYPKEIEAYLNDLNMKILMEVQESGVAFPSHAVVKGRFGIRACIVNYRTTEKDLQLLVEKVVETGRKMHKNLMQKHKSCFTNPSKPSGTVAQHG